MSSTASWPTTVGHPTQTPMMAGAEVEAPHVPGYELLGELGRGGMGIVYRARHVLLNRQVALKVCQVGMAAERFQREARLLASIRSPHVVAVFDFTLLDHGRAVLAMECVEGQNLDAVLRAHGGPLPESRVRPWMEQVCLAMIAAAEQGIIHRDLKPSNVLIDALEHAHVADFGLARSAEVVDLTSSRHPMGTPLYQSPEQAEDPHGVDTRDVYSFGATFYHVLTGQPPFQGTTAFNVMFKHKMEPLVAPTIRNPALSPLINDCLERCLAKSPRDRYQTFQDLLRSLQNPVPAAPWEEADEPRQHPHVERYKARRRLYLNDEPADLPEPDVYAFPQGITLLIGFGDLTKLQVDAVVSSDDGLLSMGGGLSAALRHVAGEHYGTDARRLGPIRAGRVVVTPAGKLPARLVFHGITVGHKGGRWVGPNLALITEIMESCFYHADTHGVQSIAFPLLGTGTAGLASDVCLDTMFRFLVRKLQHGVTSLRQACIVIATKRRSWE